MKTYTAAGTNTTQLATTAFVTTANATNANLTGPITSVGNATSVASQTGTGSTFVMNTSPTLVTPVLGVATATSVNGTSIPTSKTLVVTTDKLSALSATTSAELAGVISDETGTGKVVLSVSPALTGTPTAPTAVLGTNTTQLATTAFVWNEIDDIKALPSAQIYLGDTNGIAAKVSITGDVTLANTGVSTIGASKVVTGMIADGTILVGDLANDAVETAKIKDANVTSAKLATSLALTGTPTAPTATAGTNTTQLATTAFVTAAASSSKFVDLTTAQTVAGVKTFSSKAIISGITVGSGAGTGIENTSLGDSALAANTTGTRNTATGFNALISNTTATQNTANGFFALKANTTGYNNAGFGAQSLESNIGGHDNTATGYLALVANTSGNLNTASGSRALLNSTTANDNTAVGNSALLTITTGSGNTALGSGADVATATLTNATAIGYDAKVAASNTIQLGNTNVTSVQTSGTVMSNGFKAGQSVSGATASQGAYLFWNLEKPTSSGIYDGFTSLVNSKGAGAGGFRFYNVGANTTSADIPIVEIAATGTIKAGAVTYTSTAGSDGQVLMTNGSGVTSWGTPAASVREVADEPAVTTASQTSFTLSQTPSSNSKVKMYINGIRISNTAYNVSGTTLTYDPTKNGGYTLTIGDRIQFDYFY